MELTILRWGVAWTSRNTLDGLTRYFLFDGVGFRLFMTRKQARAWINQAFAYLRGRPDLRAEPHGWQMPKAVRVNVTIAMLPRAPGTKGGKRRAGRKSR